MKNNKTKKGFSFIELIVVVTIIAILSVVGMVSYSSVSKRSRDSRRISDLEKMRIALEMIRQVGTTYPSSINSLVTLKFLEALPKDPKTGDDYAYVRTNGYIYTIGATLEDPSSSETGNLQYWVNNP